jgi:CubicO group peptidase (beta-lactamase class C family)
MTGEDAAMAPGSDGQRAAAVCEARHWSVVTTTTLPDLSCRPTPLAGWLPAVTGSGGGERKVTMQKGEPFCGPAEAIGLRTLARVQLRVYDLHVGGPPRVPHGEIFSSPRTNAMDSLRRVARLGLPLFLGATALTAQVPFPAAAIDSIFAPYNRTDRPGCALGVYRNGQTIYSRGYGMADLNQGIAISPKTVFYIASTSKQFTAASLMHLATQGKVALDDPVRRYVPELPAYADAVTLRHLMHHQSGIRDYLGLWGMSGRSVADEIPEEAAIDLIARQQALDFIPGSRYSYSNSGYFLISVVVKRASGMTLRDYARTHLFEPLGMRDTHFHDDRTMIVPRAAEGYEPDGRGGYRIVKTSFALVGDGGLKTTVEDLAKWDENFFANTLAGEGPAWIDRLYTRGVLTAGDTTDYAAGLFRHRYRGLPTVDHGGSFIGFRAELLRFPTEHTSIGVLCNDYTAATEAMAKQVANVVLRDRLSAATASAGAPPAARPIVPATLDRYVGRFELLPGVAGSVARQATGLEMQAMGMKVALTPVTDSSFTSELLPGTFTFRTLPDGRVGLQAPGLGVDTPTPPLRPAPVLTAAERQAVVGRYQSDELMATYDVKDDGGRLMVRGGYGDWSPLIPFAPDAFSNRSAKVSVTRDRTGKVVGLRLDAARMRNIKFIRLP